MAKFRRGVTGILMALTVVVLLVTIALAIDWGVVYLARQEIQNFVDASALAGAQELPNPARARDAATDYYRRNYAQSRGLDPDSVEIQDISCPGGVPPNTQCYRIGTDEVQVTTPYALPNDPIPSPNRIRVRACRQVRLFFASLLGVSSLRVCAEAVARRGVPFLPRGLIVLDDRGRRALYLEGVARLEVPNGSVIVNSSAHDALFVWGPIARWGRGGAALIAREILITGGYVVRFDATISPPPRTGVPPTPDPLANLPPPNPTGLPIFPGRIIWHTATLQPGVYTGLVMLIGNAFVTMQPGIYIFRRGLWVSGNARLVGNNVMLYNEGGGMVVWGSARVNLTAPTSGTYANITIFQARSNSCPFSVLGPSLASWNATLNIRGTAYLPRATMLLRGNTIFQQQGMTITWRAKIDGTSRVTIQAEEPPAAIGGEDGEGIALER